MSVPAPKPEPTLRQLFVASFNAWRIQVEARPAYSPWFPPPAVIVGLVLHTYGGNVRSAITAAREVLRSLEAVVTDEEQARQPKDPAAAE